MMNKMDKQYLSNMSTKLACLQADLLMLGTKGSQQKWLKEELEKGLEKCSIKLNRLKGLKEEES